MRNIIIGFFVLTTATAAQSQSGTQLAISRFRLAGGSFNTGERTVSLDMVAAGEPTSYRVSESKDFSGASWHSLSSTSPSYTLSVTPGAKVVYVQVGKALTLPVGMTSPTKVTTTSTLSLPGDLTVAPQYLSNIVADTIILGLPDLQAKVELPSSVRDNAAFDFWVTVSNAGQSTPPGQVIQFYNSFVENSLVFDQFEVPFGVGRLVGDGCKVTDVSTIECTLAPIPQGGGTGLHVFGHTLRAVPAGQVTTSVKLRTRILGIRESNTTNNWVDTPLTIIK